jgi:MFS transporter, FHS family, L-fucose permease
LALNSIKQHHGSLSGILITGIAGGAIVPLIIGGVGDLFGLRYGMLFLYVSFGYVFSIGIWAKPFVQNKLFGFMRKSSKAKVALTLENK